jgi:DASH complex subunit DAM1
MASTTPTHEPPGHCQRTRSKSPRSRPTTPLRPSSRSSLRDSVQRGRGAASSGNALEGLQDGFAELSDAMADLEQNFVQLQLMHESLARFSESFAGFLYGMNMNAFCVDFPEVCARRTLMQGRPGYPSLMHCAGARCRVLPETTEPPRPRCRQPQPQTGRRRHGSHLSDHRHVLCRKPPKQQDGVQVPHTTDACASVQDVGHWTRTRRHTTGGKRRRHTHTRWCNERGQRWQWYSERSFWTRAWRTMRVTAAAMAHNAQEQNEHKHTLAWRFAFPAQNKTM